jgi:hypothetical protein
MKPSNGAYVVRDRYGSNVIRPNKVAAGLTRHRGYKNPDILTLAEHGTLDSLRSLVFFTSRTSRVCTCCGQRVNVLVLNDRGRARKARLKEKRS